MEKAIFSPLICLDTLVENHLSINVMVISGLSNSFLLIDLSTFMSV